MYGFDLTGEPLAIDTLLHESVWAPRFSPGGQWLAFNVGDAGGPVVVEPFPGTGDRFYVADVGWEVVWLSDSVMVYNAAGSIMRVSVSSNRRQPVGEPQLWFSDPRYLETAGPSHVVTPDGGLMYVQGLGETSTNFLRVIPDWVKQMKRAVDEANR